MTIEDPEGNQVSDAFEVSVVEAPEPDPSEKHAALIAKVRPWRNDPQWVHRKSHTDRWDRTPLAFGETVADTTLTAMSAAEAQTYADRGWTRWIAVAQALTAIESNS